MTAVRAILLLSAIAAAAYVAAALTMFAAQRRILFQPFGTHVPAASAGLPGFGDVVLETADGERLVAYWKPPSPGRATIVYFHGNGGAAADRAHRASALGASGRGVLLVEYRGYPGSTGSPSEAGLAQDADAAFAFASAETKGPLVLYGESLGSGVAVSLAARSLPSALVLDAPYTSMADVARDRFPWLPVDLLLRDRFDSLRSIPSVRCPVVILHGSRDDVVPQRMGRELGAAAGARVVLLEGSGHGSNLETAKGWAAVEAVLSEAEVAP